jgi:hypothetical protein
MIIEYLIFVKNTPQHNTPQNTKVAKIELENTTLDPANEFSSYTKVQNKKKKHSKNSVMTQQRGEPGFHGNSKEGKTELLHEFCAWHASWSSSLSILLCL